MSHQLQERAGESAKRKKQGVIDMHVPEQGGEKKEGKDTDDAIHPHKPAVARAQKTSRFKKEKEKGKKKKA